MPIRIKSKVNDKKSDTDKVCKIQINGAYAWDVEQRAIAIRKSDRKNEINRSV